MKLFKQAQKFGRKVCTKATAAGAGLMVGVHSAMAAVPADVSTSISDGKTDGVTIAGGVLGLIIAIAVFRHIRKGT